MNDVISLYWGRKVLSCYVSRFRNWNDRTPAIIIYKYIKFNWPEVIWNFRMAKFNSHTGLKTITLNLGKIIIWDLIVYTFLYANKHKKTVYFHCQNASIEHYSVNSKWIKIILSLYYRMIKTVLMYNFISLSMYWFTSNREYLVVFLLIFFLIEHATKAGT